MEHTPTPWYCDGDGVYSNKDCEGAPLAHVLSMGYDNDFRNIDARRIVACVNYCSGQPTETLEWAVTVGRSSIEHLTVLAGMLKTAERQRDELLAVLEAMLEEVAGCYCTTEAEASAVIQKVRGGEC